MVALALMVSCMPSAYTISASEAFGDGTEDIFTDGDFTSEPAAEESTPDVSSADQEETEQAQQSTLTYENDSVKVTAEALEDGALPQNTALKADGVNENSSVSYDTVSQKLSAAATDKGSSLRGFFAYDVYFADGDGNRVEPNGRVRVTFEYKTPAAPELTDAASTSVTVEKLHYNSSTGDTDVNTLQANEDLKVLNVNEGKQIQTLQVETGNAAVFAVMWDSPETADVEAEAVSGNEDEVSIASEELTDGMDISDEPEQDAAETPAAENPEVTPDAEPSEEPAVEPTEAPAENPDAEPTEAPAEDPDVVDEPAEDIESPDEVPAADENGETSLIEVLGDDTNLRVSPSIEAEVLATVNAGTQLTLLDTVTAEDGATWYKVSWEGTEAYIRSDMAQVVDNSDEAEEVEDVLESEEVSYSQTIGDVVVTATAANGVIPEGAQFVVTPIEKGSDQYTDVADRLEKKAENEDYSIAGFLAYDIYFQDSEGNKINPEDGKVKVSMEYQNATVPDEVKEADVATMAMASADESSQDDTEAAEQNLSVSVMHFVEDENGNVESVVDMTKDDTANVETNAEGEVQKAEFETESFSTFTITWTRRYYNTSKSITVHYVNFEGNDISGDQEDLVTATSGESVELKKYAKNIDNCTYVGARIDKYNGDSLKYIKATATYDRNNESWSWSIQYSTDNQNWQTSTITNVDIYLLYQEPLSIKDDLMDSGTLIPQISDALQTQINNSKNVKYTWYKSINGGNFEKVKRVKVTKNKYNIEEDATTKLSTMNVALDHGELSDTQTSVKYQVGLSIDGSEEILSGVYNVEYYRELRNGDFETPNVVISGHTDTNNWQYSNENYKNLNGVWQTTGTHAASQYSDSEGADIEIVTTATNDLSGYSWHGDVKDARGNNNHDNSLTNGQGKGQFAELNCEESGALYQDVMTYADEKLSYGLSHRARGSNSQTTEYDTMYVVIMPTKIAKTAANGSELKTQDQLVKYIQKKIGSNYTTNIAGAEEVVPCCNDNDGVYIARISSDDQDWNKIIQNKVYTAKSTLTRFFFVAGTTSSGKATVGNFLDDVQFTQGLVAADPGAYTIKVTKSFDSTLSDSQIEALKDKLTFTIKAYDSKNKEITDTNKVLLANKTFTLGEMEYNDTDGTYYKTFENVKIDANTQYLFRVEESNADINGYNLTATETVTGGTVQEDGTSTLVEEKTSAVFKFTNRYVNNQKKNISFTKIWDDFDNAYRTRPESLNVTLKGKVNGKDEKQYAVTLRENSAELSEENEDGDTVEVVSSGNWKCTWKNIPVYDSKGNAIKWSVEESEVGGSYKYTNVAEGTGNGSDYKKQNTSTIGNITTEEIQDGAIPGGSSETTQSVQSNVESNDIAVMSANASDEYGIATTAWNNWGGGSSSTFNHIDIEASGSYTFEYGGNNYTVAFDFHAGTWSLYQGTRASGKAIGTGKVDVSTFKITNKTQESGVAISGNWQSSTTSGQTWEYRISGTFNRTDTFHVHYEIPVAIDGVTINLIADFDTSYADKTYNVCPGNGNSKGIDIEMDTALAKELTGSIVLTKVINGTDNTVPKGISFTVTGPSYNATISYDQFSNGSYVISGLQVGETYTVTETNFGKLDGYTHSETLVAVNGNRGSSGTSAKVNTTSGMSTVTFTNTYTEVQKEHTLFFKKVWVGGNGEENTSEIELQVTYSNGNEEAINLSKANNWQATRTVAANVFIESAEEVGSVADYSSSVTISGDKTTAIATNTYSSSTTKSLTVTKAWAGDEGHTDLRKPIQIQLYQNSKKCGDPVELNADNDWTYTFTDLPATDLQGTSTVTYNYTVSEITQVPAYDSQITYNDNQTVATITNTLNAEELDESFYIANKLETDTVTVSKYWDDNHNQYGSRPSSLDIKLKTNTGQQVISFNFGSGESNTANQWKATLTVPKLKTGNAYEAEEVLANDTNYECTNPQPAGSDIYFVNKPKTQTLIVEKIWNDGNNVNNTRPDNVEFKLQYRPKGSNNNWQDYQNGDFTITSANADTNDNNYWYYEIPNLDVNYEYQVVETEVLNNYTPTRNSATSITNTLNWKVVKQSSSTGAKLGGAEFKLTDKDGNDVATGTSTESTGEITWNVSEGVILNGDYTLTETKAPTGYFISETPWTLTFVNGILTNAKGNETENFEWDNKTTLTIKNKVLYSLPNSGGPGTYGFTISGVAILATALLLFINNKRREEEAKRS